MSLKQQVEALLFSSGRKMLVEELATILKAQKQSVLEALRLLQSDYKGKETALMIIEEGDNWKITVREEHMHLVRSIIVETELPKAVLETLAIIAWRAPILQSDIIRIRNNKAYEHIQMLEDSDFVAREKYGRSFKLKLTPKFFEYFDVDNLNKLREQMQQQPKVEAPTQPEQNVEIPQPNNAEPNPANVQAEPEEQLPKSE